MLNGLLNLTVLSGGEPRPLVIEPADKPVAETYPLSWPGFG